MTGDAVGPCFADCDDQVRFCLWWSPGVAEDELNRHSVAALLVQVPAG